jgi:hypothetical protein
MEMPLLYNTPYFFLPFILDDGAINLTEKRIIILNVNSLQHVYVYVTVIIFNIQQQFLNYYLGLVNNVKEPKAEGKPSE